MRQLLKAIRFVAFSLLVTFLILELICRFGFVHSWAFEVHKLASAQSGKPLRVLMVGDSFSIDDPSLDPPPYGSRLDRYLESKKAGVVNIAVSGYGTPDYLDNLMWYQAYASNFHPNLVIVNYYAGNDLTDTMSRMRGLQTRINLLQGFGAPLLQRSYLIQVLLELQRKAEDESGYKAAQKEVGTTNPAKAKAVNPYFADLPAWFPEFLAESILVRSDEAKRAWKENERIFLEFKKYAQKNHGQLLINIFPETLQVNSSHYEYFKELGFQMSERYLTSTVPQDLMKQFCAREQIVCFDLLPGFKARSTEELYSDYDDHWNLAGHTLASELVRNELEEHHLLTPQQPRL